MAKRKPSRKAARKAAKRHPARRRPARKAARKAVKKHSAARRPARKRAPSRTKITPKIRPGLITHTELASTDPERTRAWCQEVLDWEFGDAMPTPTGPYHMWRFPNGTGGGIRVNNPPEAPGSIPYCEVVDIQATYSKALDRGATEMLAPQELPGGMGWIAIVSAPGGVAIGFWSAK